MKLSEIITQLVEKLADEGDIEMYDFIIVEDNGEIKIIK
jgi:hypothetical protein